MPGERRAQTATSPAAQNVQYERHLHVKIVDQNGGSGCGSLSVRALAQ
jgi:hypothetical protein